VKNLTLVCQDWGGLTGLSVVKDCPDKFSRLVIMNTGLPDGCDYTLANVWKLTPFMVWQSVVELLGKHLPIKLVFRLAMRGVSKEVLAMYDAPFPSSIYRGGAAQWPLLVPLRSSDLISGDMKKSKEFLKNAWRSPALIMFSDDDPITGAMRQSFEQMLPHAK
ncbi:Alpha/Beta hydrolase fold, partial [Trinorchestia longiramus]